MKKPVYLYLLLSLSAVITVLNLWGRFFSKPGQVNSSQMGLSGETAKQFQEIVDKSYELSSNGIHTTFLLLSVVLVVAAIVFLFQKNLVWANISYIGYVLLAIVGSIYNYISALPLYNIYTDSSMRDSSILGVRIVVIIAVVVNLIFLGIAVFKLLKLQKALEQEQETAA